MADLVNRMIRAARLDGTLYKEVETDPSALTQAVTVVVMSSVAAGIGNLLTGGIIGLIGGIVAALVGWIIWVAITYFVGTKVFPEPETKADFSEMLRSLGFASSPGVLKVFGIIPILGWMVALAASIWTLVAAVVAVKTVLDYQSTLRAFGVCVIGWICMVVIMMVMAVILFGASAVAG